MDKYSKIFSEFCWLLSDTPGDMDLFHHKMAVVNKISSLQIMHFEALEKTKEFECAAKKERSEGKVALTETTHAMYYAITFFEAYLFFAYSLFEIIAKCTPYFYGKNRSKIEDRSFGAQKHFFLKKGRQIDLDFTNYLRKKLGWHDKLINNRHAVTHRTSAFLAFKKNGSIFQDYPKKDKYRLLQKSFKDLETYLRKSLDDFFNFRNNY